MQTIQQQRAQYALNCVLKHSENSHINRKEYKSYAAALPAMIHMNGLGQAAAFYKSKSDTHRLLYKVLSDWLIQSGQPYQGKSELLKGITEENMHLYRLAQAEAQALMDWIKKFANAYMAED